MITTFMKTNAFCGALCLILTISLQSLRAQDYSWQGGLKTLNQYGTYGTKGTPAASNQPGSRMGAVTWRDKSGNFWLFGGYGYDGSASQGFLSDLWKYDLNTKMWTWMHGTNWANASDIYGTQGVPAASNMPGGRNLSCSWVDNAGNLWLFGGNQSNTSSNIDYNDLWKYNIATNQWTWVHGDNSIQMYGQYGTQQQWSPSNKPGGRHSAVCWKDAAGDFWMFGGNGHAWASVGLMSDLWRYSVSSNMWVWVDGPQNTNNIGGYGTKNVASANNWPGARQRAVAWTDNSGRLWMYGGHGFGDQSFVPADNQDDLWMFSTSTLQWTWKNGTTTGSPGVYGTKGTAANANNPGARNSSVAWKDLSGNFWMFGGRGYPDTYYVGDLCDLWKYDLSKNQWTWMEGPKTLDNTGVYGTLGVTAPANNPGGRGALTGWVDLSGHLWFFGGVGRTTTSTSGLTCDLWKYEVCNAPQAPQDITSSQNLSVCEGQTTELKALSTGTINWYAGSTGGTALSTGTNYITPPLSVSTTYYAQTMGCMPSAGRTAITVNVMDCTGLPALQDEATLFTIYPNPGRDRVQLKSGKEMNVSVFNAAGQLVRTVALNGANNYTVDLNGLPVGLYTLQGTNEHRNLVQKLVIAD